MVQQLIDRTDGVSVADISRGQWAILELMDDEGRVTRAYAAEETDLSKTHVGTSLSKLQDRGLVEKVHTGLYELADGGAE